ncbi:MAG: 2-phospho-L-lactate guanylyltransferase [Acidobacteria bacterium]|nr:MAG: 2-phospho-L-lactate guanylyltransferase [Acidobacteriota bacterium]
MILIPVKNLSTAKQRLSPALDHSQRVELAQAMLHDVLEAVGAWASRPPVALVTSDRFAAELAKTFGFEVIPDDNNQSETDAIEMATQVCQSRGLESTLVIPSDIPLVQTWELEKILQAAPPQGSVLVPAANGRGTNAALRTPAGLFPLRFGNDSFKPHFETARATGKPCIVLLSPAIALDVDDPADLKNLIAAAGERRAQRFARQLNVEDYPLAANE